MDHAEALRKARAALKARTRAGEVEPAAAAFLGRRIDRLAGRASRLRTGFERHAAAARHVNATMAAVRKARDEGRIVAIDAGWRCQGMIEEVGITTLENGRSRTRTYRSKTWRKREKALYGGVTLVDRREIGAIARRAYAEADLCVFHAAAGDLAKTGIDVATCPYADTALLASLVEDGPATSLTALHDRYVGGPQGQAHESGNDAARTMAVLLALAALPPMRETGFAKAGSPRSGQFKPMRERERTVWDKIETQTAAAMEAFRAIPFLREGARQGA